MRGFVLVLCICSFVFAASSETIKIGVLAKRGDAIALKRWNDTAGFLEAKIKDHDFEIVPLDFDAIDRAVRRGDIHFLIANSAIYVRLEHRYKISRVATLLNKFGEETFVKHFGGVVFTKSQSQIDTIDDLQNTTFGAVDPTSFGGWIMAYKMLHDRGIKPEKYFKKLEFLGTHDAVVRAVLEGKVQAGTVRSDTLERMANEGKIDLGDIFVLSPDSGYGFPFAVSTTLYPEWPIARMPDTDEATAKKVALALMSMP
ncbi:MAG: phosphate/phosphite/phosphonate ABC transporter substrate-binding protein, partial [Campylobacterota bacterium]